VGDAEDPELRVREDIARHGFHVALVPPEAGTPGWALSIGLFERHAHPELLVFGPDLGVIGPLLHHLARRVDGGDRLEPDTDRSDLLEGQPLAFRTVVPKWYGPFLGNAAWHYRSEDFPALQVFWPDPGGRYPWDPAGDAGWRDDQPLLYLPETHRALSERLVEVLRHEGAL